jgi:hypothetical protein
MPNQFWTAKSEYISACPSSVPVSLAAEIWEKAFEMGFAALTGREAFEDVFPFLLQCPDS